MTDALIAAQGVVGGFELLGKAWGAAIDTSQIKNALAAPVASQQADRNMSPTQFYAITAGVRSDTDSLV